MKIRIRKIVNFVAFNLLFFALYLNFIHKDNNGNIVDLSTNDNKVVLNETVLVDNPLKYVGQESANTTKNTKEKKINTDTEEKNIITSHTAN